MLNLISKFSSYIMIALFTSTVALGITVYVQSVRHHADESALKLKQTQLQVSNASIVDLSKAIDVLNAEIKAKSDNDLAQQKQTKKIIQAVNQKNGKIDSVINNLNKNVGKKNADGSIPKDISDAWNTF